MNLSLGSLFDGSGGFPLAGSLCGIEPKWASEVEPYPIAVTRERFPNMKHLGDISKINGAEVEPVDIITFGSPCQDMSVAGKRAGLKHEDNGDEETTRSGLFMEAVRIIKEMRKATNGEYPKFALWENVPGAFSSNKGEDFRIVLEELIKVVEPSAVMPAVPKKGWAYADTYCGDGWSLAYRVFDAQYWGVPQRRRRIYLVADFRDQRAREILFERDGLRGYFEKGRTPWQTVTRDAENSIGATDCTGEVPYTLKIRSGCEGGGKGALVQEDKSATLATNNDQYVFQPVVGIDSYNLCETGSVGRTLSTPCGGLNEHIPCVYYPDMVLDDQGGSQISVRDDGKSPTLRAETHGNLPCVLSIENHPADSRINIDDSGKVQTLTSRMGTGGNCTAQDKCVYEDIQAVAYSFDALSSNSMKSSNPFSGCRQVEVAKCLDTTDPNPCKNQGGIAIVERVNVPLVMEGTPVYCLQGNGIDRADTAGCNGKGWKEDTSYTLNTIDRPAVAFQTYQKVAGPLMANSHPGSYTGQDAFSDMLVAGAFFNQGEDVTCFSTGSFMQVNENVCPTLCAQDYKSPNCILTNYIVRRLTPTECARLQGFADKWGHFDNKDHFTEEELRFWQEVRDTYDTVIKGKNPEDLKTYTEKQMLTWYNKLHTDSSEYKMWGNGIALPTALYCMQGISEVLTKAKRRAWLNDLLGDRV